MFKTKIRLVTKDWEEIYNYKSGVKPIEGEYLFMEDLNSYFKVIKVIHVINKKNIVILVVEKVENNIKKP